MNGNKNTVLSVLAGIAIGAFTMFVGTNPKAQKTLRDGGSKLSEHAKTHARKVREQVELRVRRNGNRVA